MLARRVSFCVEARTPASRVRYGHLVLLSSVSAWPFLQGASHRCVGFHTLLRITRLKFLKRVFCNCSNPINADPKFGHQICAILNDGVVGCVGGTGDAERGPQLFHCKEGFLERCGECEQIFMLACAMNGLLGNSGIDLFDLDLNEAGMRLSLRITRWSEAGERLRSKVTSWSGKTCKAGTDSAHRRVCPGGSFGWYGCFCTAPSVQHRIGQMERSWSSLSNPSVPGQDCCGRRTRDQEKFRNGARSFKEQQKRAIVFRLEPLSKRFPDFGRVLSENRQDVTEMETTFLSPTGMTQSTPIEILATWLCAMRLRGSDTTHWRCSTMKGVHHRLFHERHLSERQVAASLPTRIVQVTVSGSLSESEVQILDQQACERYAKREQRGVSDFMFKVTIAHVSRTLAWMAFFWLESGR